MKTLLTAFSCFMMITCICTVAPAVNSHAVPDDGGSPKLTSFQQDLRDFFQSKSRNKQDLTAIIITGMVLLGAVTTLVWVICLWRIFELAGRQGWQALVPLYNIFVLMQVAKMPVWSVVLLFIPLVSGIWGVWLAIALAKEFGKSTLYALGLVLLPIFFFPHLAFGPSRYRSLNGTGKIPYRMIG
jgi:uncharacterized membrane protein YoaK (UPF0700 family)